MNDVVGDSRAKSLEAALAVVSDAVLTTDVDDRVTFLNPAAEVLTGCLAAAAAGKSLSDVLSIVHAESGTTLDSAIADAKRSSQSTPTWRHAVLVGVNDRPVLIEYSVSTFRDGNDRPRGFVIVFRDISNRRAAELALRTSEETLLANAEALFEEKERAQVTLNSIGDAVISTDFRGRVIFLNVVAEAMTGYSQSEATGRLLDEIFLQVDSSTRSPIPCPTMQAIIENRVVGLDAACSLIRRDGEELAVEVSASPIHDKNGGVIGAVMVAHDVTVSRDLSNKLARLALHDNLTDLPNRALFADRLDQALTRAQRNGSSVAVLFVDLDRFKPVNDSLGHATGDLLLKAVSMRLLGCVRGSDTVSRYGGDEFIILVADVARDEDSMLCAEKVVRAFDAPYAISGHDLKVTASVGIASFPEDATDAESLMKFADIAMYEAKHEGRNRHRRFAREMLDPPADTWARNPVVGARSP